MHERLAALRRIAGLGTLETDQLAGLSRGYTGRIESSAGRKNISLDTLRAICGVFGCSVGYLVDGEGKPPSEAQIKKAVAKARREAKV